MLSSIGLLLVLTFYAGTATVRILDGRVKIPAPPRFRFNLDIIDISGNNIINLNILVIGFYLVASLWVVLQLV